MEKAANPMLWRSICPLSSALDVLGDKWSLLIIRDLIIHGTRTYSQFLDSPEHIATNILAARLKLLAGLNLITRTPHQASSRNNAFQLTDSGAALRPVLLGLAEWAQTHLKHLHADIIDVTDGVQRGGKSHQPTAQRAAPRQPASKDF